MFSYGHHFAPVSCSIWDINGCCGTLGGGSGPASSILMQDAKTTFKIEKTWPSFPEPVPTGFPLITAGLCWVPKKNLMVRRSPSISSSFATFFREGGMLRVSGDPEEAFDPCLEIRWLWIIQRFDQKLKSTDTMQKLLISWYMSRDNETWCLKLQNST